jgi:hypothetical protein
MPITPEDRARENIDKLLIGAGWVIQDKRAQQGSLRPYRHRGGGMAGWLDKLEGRR